MTPEGRRDSQRAIREGWTVTLYVATVLDAVKRKLEWHSERLKHWQERREELKGKAAEAIRVDDPEELERLMSTMSSNSYRGQYGVRLDQEWQNDFNHAEGRLKYHQEMIREFSGWERTLGLMNPAERLELEHHDVVYFALAAPEAGAEE